jgi:N-acetyl-anhydromuramyl-L-alanine amidase AmpD
MSYPFVAAKWFSAGKRAEVRALAIHFAEGGNTVHYFQDPTRGNPPRPVDVSSTFVIEYSGRIVQMVRDGDVDHCQHISYGTWSYPGGLSRSRGVAVLGADVMNQADPTRVNRYVQAVELEGFRSKGMNADQEKALIALVAERRKRFPELRGLLGHGDIQNKACPGALIPWDKLGGHGLFPIVPPQEEEEMGQSFTFDASLRLGRLTVTETGHAYQRLHDQTLAPIVPGPDWTDREAFGPVKLTIPIPGGAGTDRTTAYIVTGKSGAAAVLAFSGTFTPDGADQAVIDKAVNLALDHVAPAASLVQTAINEARPR